jgi:hypothetical protein
MKELFQRGYIILRAAPIVLIPVAVVILYNDYSNAFFNWLTGSKPHFTLNSLFTELPAFLIRLPAVLTLSLVLLGTFTACAVSMFSMASFSLAFRRLPNSIPRAIRETRVKDILFLFLCHVIVTPVALLALALWYWLLSLTSLSLTLKSYALLLIMALAFILYYMSLATAVMVAIADGTLSDKFRKFAYFASTTNISRLTRFYLVRIGAEFIIVGVVGFALARLHIGSDYLLPMMITAVTVLPFALLRTSGFVLKLDMLRPDPYFRKQFERYYSTVASETT